MSHVLRHLLSNRLLAVVLLALAAGVPASAGAAQKPKAPGILYSLDAKDVIVTTSGGRFRVSIPVNAPVTWFTDRPDRKAGSIRLVDLYRIWDASGFVKDPPNAALLTTHEGVDRTHVVEMTKPKLADRRVSFAIRAIPQAHEAGHAHADELVAGTFARARLFIDDAALSPCPSSVGPPAAGGVSGTVASLTPTTYKCLLAPGTTTSYSTTSTTPAYVSACSTGTKGFTMPAYSYGVSDMNIALCTLKSSFIVSSGFGDTNTTVTIGSRDCVTPSTSSWPVSVPATAPSAAQITVTSGKTVSCPFFAAGETITY